MENQSIKLPPAPRTLLANLFVVSRQREPGQPELLPPGKSLTMSEGDAISFMDTDRWSQGIFLEDTTIKGPLVFARAPKADLTVIAKDRFQNEQGIMGIFGALLTFISAFLAAVLAADNAGGYFNGAIAMLSVSFFLGLLIIFGFFARRAKMKTDPVKFMRARDIGRDVKVFLPGGTRLLEAA